MKLRIITVGKPKLKFITPGVEMYLKRLSAYGESEWITVKSGSQQVEGEFLLKASKSGVRVVLDEHGKMIGSPDLAEKITNWEFEAVREVNFLIGGADGHADEVKAAADWMWSLSKLTLQHELALLVLMEQVYRAQTIRRGEPYHRE
ncbi:MAG: 23S rRNA (pseudouridine(1915)-N(3))-methyltransferase RlmH [Verrucomicrobiota bacterium]